MKCLVFAAFLVAVVAEFDISQVEHKELYVPKDPQAFLSSYGIDGYVEKQRQPRIAYGMNATEGQFPYALRVTVFDTTGDVFVCSGVIIGPTFMLTVRHCFDPTVTFSVMGSVGSVNRNSPDFIDRFSDHWWFAPPIQGWNPDLAVVRMAQPFPFGPRIGSVRLPSNSQRNYQFAQYLISIIGWGRNRNGDMPQVLKWGRFRIETACWNNMRPTHMCSEPVDGWHVETRGGDSGGPWVTVEGDGQPTLIALTEGSTGSQTRWWFRGTRLTSFLDFISSVSGIPIRP